MEGEYPANMILLRGFAKLPALTTLPDAHGIRCAAIAAYPMYRGLGRLVGMDVLATGRSIGEECDTLARAYGDYDFFFVHVKPTDSRGEDGDFDGKVAVIEEVDGPSAENHRLESASSGGDGRPQYAGESLGSLLASNPRSCYRRRWRCRTRQLGSGRGPAPGAAWGVFPARSILALALAHAMRLKKFGA